MVGEKDETGTERERGGGARQDKTLTSNKDLFFDQLHRTLIEEDEPGGDEVFLPIFAWSSL
jgi:hypothetical protein